MKQTYQFGLLALLLALSMTGTLAQTTFFTDTFSNGSTTNLLSVRGGSPTASSTSYDIASSKNTIPGTNGVTITANDFKLALVASTTSGYLEAQALFATNGHPVSLNAVGDYIDIAVVFTNTTGTLLAGGIKSALWLGLYNSGGSAPVSGGALASSGLTTNANSLYATGNCANWQGYAAEVNSNGVTRIVTRPLQNGALSDSADQELCGNNVSNGTFDNPGATVIETAPTTAIALTAGGVYTFDLRLTMNTLTSLMVSNYIYSGAGVNGTVVFAQGSAGGITNGALLTTAFDGLAVGEFNSGTSFDPTMDISSILVTGQSTPVSGPPNITLQPVPAVVATNGACVFTVAAFGTGVGYQWNRNNAILTNGMDISGATTPQLLIFPAQAEDAFSGTNGYYCTVTNSAGYATNSVTNSLTLVPATNLIFTASGGATWDLDNTVSWEDTNLTATVFSDGDSVRFDDTASLFYVTVTGGFLAASSVTVDSEGGNKYTLTGSGNIAGPGSLIYTGTGQLALDTTNTYRGGTLISNTVTPAALRLYLGNYGGLGTGPVTLDNAGGTLETAITGGSSTGINGDINLLDDFTIQVDGTGTYATVFLGDLSGTFGKTLTINPETAGTVNRFRAYGTNTVFNANLVLDTVNSSTSQALYNGSSLAPYEASGSQSYNGTISGYGGIVQRGTGTTYLNNNQNSYSGGTFPTAGTIAFGADTIVDVNSNVLSGPIGTGPLFLAPEAGEATGSGTVLAAGSAHTIANPLQYPTGSNNLTLIVGGTNDLTFTAPFSLAGLDGVTSNAYTTRTLQIANSGATTFGGAISDASGFNYALTKTGAGALYLNAANTYPGLTTNSAGLLAGSGSVAGSVIVTTNASIGGGAATGIGTFTIGGNLTLTNGNGFFRLNKSLTPSNDVVSVSGSLITGGTGVITVTNLNPGNPLQLGDTFFLFNKGLSNGAALTVTGGGVTWSNSLAFNGSIVVVPSTIIPTVSPHIGGFTIKSGTNVLITATNGMSNGIYYLLESTNVAKPLSQWTPVATNVVTTNGASGAFTFTGTNVVTPGAAQQFYILSNTNN